MKHTHTTVETEKGASSGHKLRTQRVAHVVSGAKSELAANGCPIMKKANGRLHPRLGDPPVCCNGTAQNVLSRESVDRVFRDVIERCAVQRNPGGAIPRNGSSDRSGGCLELRGGMENVMLLPTSSIFCDVFFFFFFFHNLVF